MKTFFFNHFNSLRENSINLGNKICLKTPKAVEIFLSFLTKSATYKIGKIFLGVGTTPAS